VEIFHNLILKIIFSSASLPIVNGVEMEHLIWT